jgi:PTH1 family peptidyl-tRNA hydrolase
MLLVVGLGNYGNQYKSTRHNAGFIVADYLSKYYKLNFSTESKFQAEIASGIIRAQKLLIVKPTSYMNLSGRPVSSICAYYKIDLDRIIVIHDDIDLEIGRVKCKLGGSSGGHNGIKSIDSYIGNNYYRIRIGISRPDSKIEVSDYVLQNFKPVEYTAIHKSAELIASNFDLCIQGNLTEFNNKIRSIV